MDSYLLRNVREIGIVNIINNHFMFLEHQEKNKKVLDEIKKIEYILTKFRNRVNVPMTIIRYSDKDVYYFQDTPENKKLKIAYVKKKYYDGVTQLSGRRIRSI